MTQYPTWPTGQVLVADRLSEAFPIYAYKLTNLDRVSWGPGDPDPDLQFELEESATYLVEFHLFAGGSSSAKFQGHWEIPNGWSGTRGVLGPQFAGTDDTPITMRATVEDCLVPLAFGYRPAGSASLNHIYETGMVVTDQAGILSYSWGQQASAATIARLGRGSWGRVTRIA